MSQRYTERKKVDISKLTPGSPRQKGILKAIRNILAEYMVRGDSKNLDAAALRIWRETRR